jgi:hypothetical protein
MVSQIWVHVLQTPLLSGCGRVHWSRDTSPWSESRMWDKIQHLTPPAQRPMPSNGAPSPKFLHFPIKPIKLWNYQWISPLIGSDPSSAGCTSWGPSFLHMSLFGGHFTIKWEHLLLVNTLVSFYNKWPNHISQSHVPQASSSCLQSHLPLDGMSEMKPVFLLLCLKLSMASNY